MQGRDLLVLVLVLNALFWGLASHGTHCSVVPRGWCVPHDVHLMLGVACFVAAVLVRQRKL